MNTDQIIAIKRTAENATGPCTTEIDEENSKFSIIGPDGDTVLFTSIPDVASLNFHATAREKVIALCEELIERTRRYEELSAIAAGYADELQVAQARVAELERELGEGV
jgi:hypothetical protein